MRVLVSDSKSLPRCGSCRARIVNYDWAQHGSGVPIESAHIVCSRCRATQRRMSEALALSGQRSVCYSDSETFGDHSDEIVEE